MMNNTVNNQFSSFNNSINNSSFENTKLINSKRTIQEYPNKISPIQFGFNFYFNNIKPSPFTPINSPKNQSLNKSNNIKPTIPIYCIFKASLEKSGYKITPEQSAYNHNEYFNEYSNNINYNYDDSNYYNFPINENYSSNNNSIINNIYPTITKITSVKILSDNNDNSNSKTTNYSNSNKDKIIDNNNFIKKESINDKVSSFNVNIEKKGSSNTDNKIPEINNKPFDDNLLNKKTKVIFECSESKEINGHLISKNFIKKKRFRKNNEQIALLSKFYNENKNWSKNEIKEMSKNIGLKENKIYKWLWDQKNKEYNKSTKFIINKNDI